MLQRGRKIILPRRRCAGRQVNEDGLANSGFAKVAFAQVLGLAVHLRTTRVASVKRRSLSAAFANLHRCIAWASLRASAKLRKQDRLPHMSADANRGTRVRCIDSVNDRPHSLLLWHSKCASRHPRIQMYPDLELRGHVFVGKA